MSFDFSITLKDVSLERGTTPIVSGLSLSIAPKDLIWIGGDNGIGKSSILRLLAGLLRPQSGSLDYALENTPCLPAQLISYQGHSEPLKPQERVSEAIKFWASLSGHKTGLDAAMDRVGISGLAGQFCHSLSAGQSRRLALAKLLIENKPVWLLDEPSAAMDSAGQDLIDDLITAHIEAGGAAMIASHAAPKRLAGAARYIRLTRAEAA